MPVKAGEGYVDLIPKVSPRFTSQVRAQLSTAGKQGASAFQSAFSGATKQLGALGIGGGGLGVLFGAASVGAVVAGIKKVADETAAYAGEVRSVKAVTGATAEDSSRLVAILHDLGIEASTVGRPFLTLSQNVSSSTDKFHGLFSESELAKFRGQDLSRTVLDIGDKFKTLEDPLERNQLLVDAFGKRGAALRPIFSASREELERFARTAERAGLIFNDEQLAQAREYQIAVRELEETFHGLTIQAGRFFIPIVTDVLKDINTIVLGIEDGVRRTDSAIDQLFDLPRGTTGRNFSEFIRSLIIPDIKLPDSLTGVGLLAPPKASDERWAEWARVAQAAARGASGDIANAEAQTRDLNRELDLVDPKTLEELELAAGKNKDAASRLGEAYKLAFSIADKAAAEFDKRLEELVPQLGEVFKAVKIEGFEEADPEAEAKARDDLSAAQDRLAKAEQRLNDVRKNSKSTDIDIATAEHAVDDPGHEKRLRRREWLRSGRRLRLRVHRLAGGSVVPHVAASSLLAVDLRLVLLARPVCGRSRSDGSVAGRKEGTREHAPQQGPQETEHAGG